MRITALLTAVALSSCSLIGTRRPDPPPYTAAPECSAAYGRPLADAFIGAGGLGLVGLGAFLATRPPDPVDGSTNGALGAAYIAGGVAVAGLFITSAIIGYPRVTACREAVAAWQGEHPELARVPSDPIAAARAHLRCPTGRVGRRELRLADQHRDSHGWASFEVQGCERIAWCGELENGTTRCGQPADFELAAGQVAVETGCPAASVEQLQFYGVRTQNTYRLNACGAQYSCIVPLVDPDGSKGNADRVAGSPFGSQLTCKPVFVQPQQQEPESPPPPAQP